MWKKLSREVRRKIEGGSQSLDAPEGSVINFGESGTTLLVKVDISRLCWDLALV